MNRARESRLIIVLLLSCFAVLVAGCRPRPSANEKRYPINGKVVAINKTDRTATIEHEDIVGYMPAMTMPFRIKNDADLEMMKPGDQVTGSLVVNDTSSWVEIATIAEGTAPLSPTAEIPGEPKPGDEVPDFGLTNQDGKRIHLAQYRGKALALTFVYLVVAKLERTPALRFRSLPSPRPYLATDTAWYLLAPDTIATKKDHD